MKIRRLFLISEAFLFAAMTLPNAMAQSQASSDETQALRKLVDQMQAQMAKMQAEIDQLKGTKTEVSSTQPTQATQAPTTPPVPAPRQNGTIQAAEPPRIGATSEHLGEATANYREFSEDTFAAARFNNVPLDPKYQGFFQLPGTQTILKIGGYFKTDFIYDLKPAGNLDSFIPSSFPIPQPTSVNNSTISVRPTRLSLDFRIPYTQVGEVRFYVEGDFFGTNATTPRLRHAYAQARNLLIGQTFTNFMDPDASRTVWTSRDPTAWLASGIRNFAMDSHSVPRRLSTFPRRSPVQTLFSRRHNLMLSRTPRVPMAQFACARNSNADTSRLPDYFVPLLRFCRTGEPVPFLAGG